MQTTSLVLQGEYYSFSWETLVCFVFAASVATESVFVMGKVYHFHPFIVHYYTVCYCLLFLMLEAMLGSRDGHEPKNSILVPGSSQTES